MLGGKLNFKSPILHCTTLFHSKIIVSALSDSKKETKGTFSKNF